MDVTAYQVLRAVQVLQGSLLHLAGRVVLDCQVDHLLLVVPVDLMVQGLHLGQVDQLPLVNPESHAVQLFPVIHEDQVDLGHLRK